ncbi:ADP-ribosylglycohydrolase family protein [Paenibacillus oryzisoli]|uniref:ADP-ribosylglycohydrolase family protein n=1 Tax=Paenibacillus oryzisoli TaxID=1850517 RepID=UPI003D2AC0CE
MLTNAELQDRIKGGLYGVAIGDALGGTTEFMGEAEVAAEYGYLTDIIGGGVWGLRPGEVTDDTMMTLCVAEGLLASPADPVAAIGERFLAWYASRPKDIGNIVRRTLASYRGDWFAAALATHDALGQSAGNGTLMRCLPVALGCAELPEVERLSRQQSAMTHYDERCAEACVIYNRIAHRLLRGEGLAAAVRQELVGTAYADIAAGALPGCEPTGYVVHTFRWVLYIVLEAADFSDAVQRAANLGGDSDTIGAIAGGLAGIACGFAQLPKAYAVKILIRSELDEVSERLYHLHCSQL